MNELKPFRAAKVSYVCLHNLEDCKNMFESFMNGIQSVVEMLYQMCLKWTPAHLRNLANKIEKAGCKNLVEYRKYVKNHSYREDYEIDRQFSSMNEQGSQCCESRFLKKLRLWKHGSKGIFVH